MVSSQQDPSGTAAQLHLIYQELFARYGPQHWWPADEPFEVMVGAVLTQSAAWTNVEKAIANLKQAGVLSPRSLREIPSNELARLVYSSGYYNAKASKLKALVQYLGDRYQDNLLEMFTQDAPGLREELLAVHGVGEETADSILLYAAAKPVFVVDAYTRRELFRIGLCSERDSYRTLQSLFMENLSPDTQLFNEFHALIVRHGKEICRKRPLCGRCCLLKLCCFGQHGQGPKTN